MPKYFVRPKSETSGVLNAISEMLGISFEDFSFHEKLCSGKDKKAKPEKFRMVEFSEENIKELLSSEWGNHILIYQGCEEDSKFVKLVDKKTLCKPCTLPSNSPAYKQAAARSKQVKGGGKPASRLPRSQLSRHPTQ